MRCFHFRLYKKSKIILARVSNKVCLVRKRRELKNVVWGEISVYLVNEPFSFIFIECFPCHGCFEGGDSRITVLIPYTLLR